MLHTTGRAIATQAIARPGALLGALLLSCSLSVSLAASVLESPRIKIEFDDATRAPVAITDKANNDRQALDVAEEFSFIIDGGAGDQTVSASRSRLVSSSRTDCSCTIRYAHTLGAIDVAYTLAAAEHYVRKSIRFTPSFAETYAIKRVKTWVFTPAGARTRAVHQHGDGGYTYFLRGTNSSLFSAVQVIPGIPIALDSATPVELQYDANIKLAGPYDAEMSILGCATRSGHAYSTGLRSLHRCPTSPVGLDDGEAEAMVAVMADLAPNRHRDPIVIHFNGWQSGINITEKTYQDPRFKQTLLSAKEMLGPGFYLTAAYPWFGHKERMPGLSPADTRVPYSAAEETDFIQWLHANQIRSLLWTSTAHASINPAEPRYCRAYEPFRLPGTDENCIAHDAFMKWLAMLTINELKKGHDGWSHDEEGQSNRYSTYRCDSNEHSHLAGAIVAYGCYYERKKMWKALRAQFGEDFELWCNRQEIDTGPWEWLDLTTVCSFGENPDWNNSPQKVRYNARARHFYHFCPSWMHQVLLYPRQSGQDIDKLMLSALAVSSNYLFGDGVNVPGRDRIRHWLDWARSHAAFMRSQSQYLPQWPSEGVDGYVRSADGSAYLFLFNDYGDRASVTVSLDAGIGLDHAATYTASQVFPAQEMTTVKGELTVSLNAGEYRLIAIERPR